MNTDSRAVELFVAGGVVPGELTFGQGSSGADPESYWVRLVFGERSLLGKGDDYFEALLALRRQLEPQGTRIRINGAARNVWPSGMSCSVGGGIQAYRMTLGTRPRLADLVHIFEYTAGVEVVTIEQQERFRDQWFASLGAA